MTVVTTPPRLSVTAPTPLPERAAPLAGSRRGEWAVVLGVSSGMGREVARRLAIEGMHILGVHLDTAGRAAEVEELVDELSAGRSQVHLINGNAASPATRMAAQEQLVRLCQETGSGIGVMLHSLAFGSLLPFVAETPDSEVLAPKQMTMTVEVMAHSLVWWVRDLLAAGLLPAGSHVLAMTSAGDSRVTRSYGAVSAAKAALCSHVRQLAVELAPHGVAVNAIRAGVTLTPSLQRIPEHEALLAAALAANPGGRITTPEDIAEAVSTLSRSRSTWLTGNVVNVDGGEGLTV